MTEPSAGAREAARMLLGRLCGEGQCGERGQCRRADCETCNGNAASALDAFAAAHMKAWRHERRQMSPDGPHCDLCQERVQGDGSDWRWVDEGWSLACLSCLEKIAAARVAAERELCAMIVHKWFAAQFKEYERAHHADEGAVEAMYDHATNVLDDIIVEIRQRADAAQSAPPEARDA